jgi:hypothetical protein
MFLSSTPTNIFIKFLALFSTLIYSPNLSTLSDNDYDDSVLIASVKILFLKIYKFSEKYNSSIIIIVHFVI